VITAPDESFSTPSTSGCRRLISRQRDGRAGRAQPICLHFSWGFHVRLRRRICWQQDQALQGPLFPLSACTCEVHLVVARASLNRLRSLPELSLPSAVGDALVFLLARLGASSRHRRAGRLRYLMARFEAKG